MNSKIITPRSYEEFRDQLNVRFDQEESLIRDTKAKLVQKFLDARYPDEASVVKGVIEAYIKAAKNYHEVLVNQTVEDTKPAGLHYTSDDVAANSTKNNKLINQNVEALQHSKNFLEVQLQAFDSIENTIPEQRDTIPQQINNMVKRIVELDEQTRYLNIMSVVARTPNSDTFSEEKKPAINFGKLKTDFVAATNAFVQSQAIITNALDQPIYTEEAKRFEQASNVFLDATAAKNTAEMTWVKTINKGQEIVTSDIEIINKMTEKMAKFAQSLQKPDSSNIKTELNDLINELETQTKQLKKETLPTSRGRLKVAQFLNNFSR